ncbi:MAG TPA: ComF family protein [Clostridiales bacterium]|jgi:ComF family protein|nr:ComF family protein [Clostridiales bacterium]
MIYPVRCPVCDDIVIPKGRKICDHCEDKLQIISEPRCKKCSKPIEQEQREYCSDCERKRYHFEYGYSLWIYDTVMKKSVSDFKYCHKKEYANYYVEKIVNHFKDEIIKMNPDALIPVPIHRSKYRDREYNQAEILAYGIGKKLNIPVVTDLLIRNKKTLPQKQLSDKERLKNLQEAFMVNAAAESNNSKKLSRILLIDDIYTTGSTIEACTRALIRHGIEHVYFITLCIGKGF